MAFARGILRPIGFFLLLVMMVLSVTGSALALGENPVSFSFKLSPDRLEAPGPVTVSLNITNTSGADMIAPVTLYDPAGSVVTSFGDGGSYVLKAGESLSWTGNWNVTQSELMAGVVSYSIRYHVEDSSGALVEMSHQVSIPVQFQGESAALFVQRSIEPQVVRSGSQATVNYELLNSGNVQLTDIRVQENISKTAKSVKTLGPGERTTVTFSSRIGNANLTSNAQITYKAANDTQTKTVRVEDAVIPLAKPDLKLNISSAADAVNIGEEATLIVTFTNNGNVNYSNVTVTDAKLGDILTGISIPAGETVVKEKKFKLSEPTTFKVTATLPDNTGETKKMTSNELRIGVYDPEKQLLLTLNLTADQESISHQPADVKFHLKVTNNSNITAEKIAITHGRTSIYTIASLAPGASTTLDRDIRISQAGQFRFTATLKDSLNNEVVFESNTITIPFAHNTPAPTPVPMVTVAPPEYVTSAPVDPLLSQGRGILRIAMLVLMGLFAAAVALFAVSSLVRLNKSRKSKAAYDHLDLAERRNYAEPADEDEDDEEEEPESKRPLETEEENDYEMPILPIGSEKEASAPEAEAILPHEKLLRSSAQTDAYKAPAQDEMPTVDGDGGYRLKRADAITPEWSESEKDAVANAAPVNPAPRRHRRAARKTDEE